MTETAAPGGAAALIAGGAAPNGQDPGAAPPPDWAPEDARELVQAKGWKQPGDVVAGYRELERFLGADKAARGVVLPKDDNDAEGWGQLWQRLGRPEKPQGYGLDKIQGANPQVVEPIAQAMHELGLSTRQATKLAEAWVGLSQRVQEEGAAQRQTEAAERAGRELEEVKRAWGADYEPRADLATRFALSFIGAVPLLKEDLTLANGMVVKAGRPDPRSEEYQDLVALEEAWGTRKLLQRMYAMGARMGEMRNPDGGGPATVNPATREGALEEIQKLRVDKEFQQRLKDGDAFAREQWDNLYKTAYPS
jgi:hypothetical protein